jgi:biopolymer transport protein ExbB
MGEALIWVGLPDLKPGMKTDLWLYSKNPKAVPAEDAKGTFDKSATLVWHFAEKGAPPKDSTSWANNGANAGVTSEGAQIGRGLRFDGASTLPVPAGPSIAWAAAGKSTWSAWIKPADADATAAIFSRREGASALVAGLHEGKAFVELQDATGAHRAEATARLAPGKWHHLAFTTGDDLVLFVDGAPAGTTPAKLPVMNGPSILGGDAPESKEKPAEKRLPPFKGELDELEMAKVDRPAGFIQFAFATQGPDPARVIGFGPDEESGSWSGGYFTVIIKSVTLDGWVVIGLLAIMMVVSWLVMIGKAQFLGGVERSNEKFTRRFRALSGELVALVHGKGSLGDDKVYERSPLYRIWRVGAEEVNKRSDGTRPLSAQSIESIRASLDAQLIRENQRLSERMVLLTIAISGGPFLGLLGTVVGVMITFAAIAAAGDVNVNAIAPGIAAALVATVAGLAVAIPALFGYNWLLTRIKNLTANQQVFVDELETRFAETYSESNLFAAHSPRKAAGER